MFDFDFKTPAGWQKMLAFVLNILATLAVSFGMAQAKVDSTVATITVLLPTISMILYFVVNQIAATGKAKTEVIKMEIANSVALTNADTIAVIAETKPEVAAQAIIETVPFVPVRVEIKPKTAIPSTPDEVKAWQEKVKVDIDNELAASFRLPSAEAARKAHPELSSLNPSIVWSKTQIRLMDTLTGNVVSNSEAIYATENILLPAAQNALIDQQGQVLEQGITCNWKPSYMGQQWVKWCKDHIYSLKEVGGLFDFKGYTVWKAGEIATAWVLHNIPWITDYKAGKATDYIFPDKP